MKTVWTVESGTVNLAGLRPLRLTVETDDPRVVAMIELAAERAGIKLKRLGEGE